MDHKRNVGAVLFVIWAIGVAIFWIVSTPESAPQQAALAGQALVLVCIPYCVLSVLQRSALTDGVKTEARDKSVLELRNRA